MKPLRFAFVLHIHQPVGNFDFVFREHAQDVYRPFLDFLDERALWPIGLHVSGPLLEWLGENDAPLHDRIGRLVVDERVELLSAGWYEPILAALEPVDRATQLGWMREELEGRFGVTPRGSWLTERVWTSELARDLADAGIAYALVDDHLLRRGGVGESEIRRPVAAGHSGRRVELLGIDEGLRYLIPFQPADRVAHELVRRYEARDPIALFADDGEKFGGWPRTREWLYDLGWLEAFGERMDTLRSEGTVRLVTTAQALDELGRGREVELPEGSYPEMDVWAGGPWVGFLDRYDEAGRLHSWMTELSRECRQRGDARTARRKIGRAQCNDAYWHGVFGGLYMRHLREGARGNLAEAARSLAEGESLRWTAVLDRAGRAQQRLRSARLVATVDGESGGTLAELVWLEPYADVTNYLTRRREAYHETAFARHRAVSEASGGDEGTVSIHEIEAEATLERLPPIDSDVRVLCRERVLGADVDLESYRDGDFEPLWVAQAVTLPEPEAFVGRDGLAWAFANGPGGPSKSLLVADDWVELTWKGVVSVVPESAWFAPELSIACDVEISYEPAPDEVWRYAIVTTSKCPDGFEQIEQGTSITPRWPSGIDQVHIVIRPG